MWLVFNLVGEIFEKDIYNFFMRNLVVGLTRSFREEFEWDIFGSFEGKRVLWGFQQF